MKESGLIAPAMNLPWLLHKLKNTALPSNQPSCRPRKNRSNDPPGNKNHSTIPFFALIQSELISPAIKPPRFFQKPPKISWPAIYSIENPLFLGPMVRLLFAASTPPDHQNLSCNLFRLATLGPTIASPIPAQTSKKFAKLLRTDGPNGHLKIFKNESPICCPAAMGSSHVRHRYKSSPGRSNNHGRLSTSPLDALKKIKN